MKEVWHVRPDYGKENVYRIWNENDNYHDDTSPEKMDDRARLIAAAPDLLAALKLLLEENEDYIRINKLSAMGNVNLVAARAAIAKAEGSRT